MYGNNNLNRYSLREALGLPDKIPASHQGTYEGVFCKNHNGEVVGPFTIVVKAGSEKHSSQHRVLVKCKCGRLIPAGRLDQHKCPA